MIHSSEIPLLINTKDKRPMQNSNLFLDFRSHKQKIFQTIQNSQEYQYKCEMELKKIIHQWLNYQNKLNHHIQPSLEISKLFLSRNNNRNNNEIQESQQIRAHRQDKPQSDSLTENNPLSVQLIHSLYQKHPLFKKINFHLTETLINIGVFSLYKKNEPIPYIFYTERQKNHCNQNKRLGFVIYGKLKLFDKVNKYQKIINQNQTIGQHGLSSLGINFTDYRDVKVKCFTEETAILWVTQSHFEILSKESMRCGLKEQLRKLQSFLKISWIHKKIKRF